MNILVGFAGLFRRNKPTPQEKALRKIMSALDNLNAAVAALTTAVDSAVTVLNTPHPADAQVQAAADAVNAQAARLSTAAQPPAPQPAS